VDRVLLPTLWAPLKLICGQELTAPHDDDFILCLRRAGLDPPTPFGWVAEGLQHGIETGPNEAEPLVWDPLACLPEIKRRLVGLNSSPWLISMSQSQPA
jgi:hypothetical protein